MDDDLKLLWLFTEVHGEITGSCYTEILSDDEGAPVGIAVMKDENHVEYLTRHL